MTRFFNETVTREDGTSYDREVIEVDSQDDGTSTAARVATDADRVEYADAYAEFKNPPPSYEELLAEWRERHPIAVVASGPAVHRGAPSVSGATGGSKSD